MLSVALRLSFLTDQSKIVNLRLLRAYENVTPSQISEAMETMIESEAFDTNGKGNIVTKSSAQLIITTIKRFDV